MNEKPTKRGCGAILAVALFILLVILPMLYVVSVGPVVRMVQDNRVAREWLPVLMLIYAPLEWTAGNVPIVGPAIQRSVNWWQRPQAVPLSIPAPTAASP